MSTVQIPGGGEPTALPGAGAPAAVTAPRCQAHRGPCPVSATVSDASPKMWPKMLAPITP
ncbi:MAG: hypothetical protein ACRDQG_00045 [Pseudonocardiaceae bacterium]